VLLEPVASLTDLALGLVSLYLFVRFPRDRPASRYWRATFFWAAVAALGGAVHHAVLVGDPQVARVSWAIVSSMVVVVMSFLLAASVIEVLGRSRAIVFWPLRLVGLVAYAIFAVTGHASIAAIMWCESITVACVLGLWVWAAAHGHPKARPMLIAIGASIAAAMFRLVPGLSGLVGLEPDSAYHLGQIAGMVLLFTAAAGGTAALLPRRAGLTAESQAT
jgi:hypothetical protein